MPQLKPLFLLTGLAVLSACQSPSPQPAGSISPPLAISINSPKTTGNLRHPELTEVSGLAASTRRSDVLWAINDSGNQAKLYAMDQTGGSLGSFNVAATNRDWEDMASAWINGESYLLIGEIGDNLKTKAEHAIYILAEPLLDGSTTGVLEPVHTLRFRYPEGSHDAESLAFAEGWIYLLTKESQLNGKRQASKVYRIPIDFALQGQLIIAEHIASLAMPRNTIEASLIASLSGVDVSQPTAFDIDQQNRHAYVLTYRNVYRYTREPSQIWAEVLAQPRTRVHTHSLSQAEALAVSDNGVVWFTSEKLPAPLWALPSSE